MNLTNKIKFAIIASTVLLSGFMAATVNAESVSTNAAQGMEISPALVELNAARGKTYDIKLNIRNVTASDMVYTASVDDFSSADETGSPHIILDSTLPATASIRSWVSTNSKFTLAAHEQVVVNAQITVPNNAEPGGHYGVLRFSGAAPDVESTGVGLSASAGVLILVRVGDPSEIVDKADLASFYTAQDDKQTSFFENGPITFVTRIKNEGNIHIKPTGSIQLHDMFGGLVATMSVNGDKANILPSSIRKFESKYNNQWMIGRYTADLTLGYGTTGQAITNTISFWVIPYKLILACLLALVTIVFIFKRLLNAYNRHIIVKSKNENTIKNKKHTSKKD